MNRKELAIALKIALSDEPLENVEIHHFDGFGLPEFQPVICTLEQVAVLIRWQCVYFNGGLDQDALFQISECGRTRFKVLA